MLWAIDVGNTQTVVGLWDGEWRAVWRFSTRSGDTEDQTAASLAQLCALKGLPFQADGVIVGSVVPSVNADWRRFGEEWLQSTPLFLKNGADVGLDVLYRPADAVGADRIANALAAIEQIGTPVIVVDFGTATTFDVVDAQGRYAGGAIMPGVSVSLEALASRAAKLPSVSLDAPRVAVGTDTVDALRSGTMYGYAGAVDNVVRKIRLETGDARAVATGGLSDAFLGLSEEIGSVYPNLTIDGLRTAYARLASR
ncbi:MAG: type III pantothenate kinase [Armatimonadetes bacterium]|nr:type III pantothenate kinase [Armatimonadota bacterium]